MLQALPPIAEAVGALLLVWGVYDILGLGAAALVAGACLIFAAYAYSGEADPS